MPAVDVDRTKNEPQRMGADRPPDWPTPDKGGAKESWPPLSPSQQRLVERNMGLAYKLAGQYQERIPGLSDDISGAALTGLCEAAQTWVEARGVPFSAYARNRIIGSIKDLLVAEFKAGMVGASIPPIHEPLRDGPTPAPRERSGEDRTARFEELIAPLTNAQQDVCRAIFAAGLSQRETAKLRGTPKTHVAETLAAALKTLRTVKAG